MLGPTKADTPRALLGNAGVSSEEANGKGGSTVMRKKKGEQSCEHTAMRAGVHRIG